MLENTMTLYVLSAVYFSINAISIPRLQLLYLTLASAAIVLAMLSKGIPGIFPVVVFGLFTLTQPSLSFRRSLLLSGELVLIVVALFSVILMIPDAFESLTYYVENRLLFRIENEPIVTNRFYIIRKLLLELVPSLIIVAGILVIKQSCRTRPQSRYLGSPIFFY